jgi:hypothetical protein
LNLALKKRKQACLVGYLGEHNLIVMSGQQILKGQFSLLIKSMQTEYRKGEIEALFQECLQECFGATQSKTHTLSSTKSSANRRHSREKGMTKSDKPSKKNRCDSDEEEEADISQRSFEQLHELKEQEEVKQAIKKISDLKQIYKVEMFDKNESDHPNALKDFHAIQSARLYGACPSINDRYPQTSLAMSTKQFCSLAKRICRRQKCGASKHKAEASCIEYVTNCLKRDFPSVLVELNSTTYCRDGVCGSPDVLFKSNPEGPYIGIVELKKKPTISSVDKNQVKGYCYLMRCAYGYIFNYDEPSEGVMTNVPINMEECKALCDRWKTAVSSFHLAFDTHQYTSKKFIVRQEIEGMFALMGDNGS